MAAEAKPFKYQDTIGSPSRSEKTVNRVLSQSTRVHVLRDKFEPEEVARLEQLAFSLGAQVTSGPIPANVIVTALKAPKRIAKHLEIPEDAIPPLDADMDGEDPSTHAERDWSKFVVTPEWLTAVQTKGTLVDPDDFPPVPAAQSPSSPTHVSKRKRSSEPTPTKASPEAKSATEPKYGSGPAGDTSGKQVLVPKYTNSRFACQRPSPLKCVNQPVVDELKVICDQRRLTGDTFSEMAYMRAMSALKAYPYHIPSAREDGTMLQVRLAEVEKLKGVGKKVFSLIKQFYERDEAYNQGSIIEAKVIKRDRAMFIMNAFTELYGIGPIGAREAYNQGHRTFADVLKKGKSLATHLTPKESLRVLPELRQHIPRHECEEISELIMKFVKQLLPPEIEVKHQICGGYRRGKPFSYDLDLIIGHSEKPSRALHERLLKEMQSKGLVSHIVSITTAASADADPGVETAATSAGAIHVDIANIVVIPPVTKTNPNPLHRRVDLVFCPMRIYGATVLGWTGSMMFERDLRVWAKSKGYNFHNDGLTNLAEECVMDTPTEQSVFDILELEYMPPEYRNCDA